MSIFESLPLFLLSLFWPPPFSISLSLSISCSFLFSPSCLFFFCFILVSSFCLFLSFCFVFAFVSWKEQHQNIKLYFFHQSFLIFLVSCLVFLSNPFFLCLLFPDLELCCVQHECFWFQNKQLKQHKCLVKRWVATKRVLFINLCFAKCEKLSFFWGALFGKFGCCSKNTIKTDISAHFKSKKAKQWPILNITNWAKLMVANWAKFWCPKKANLAQLVTTKSCACT